VIGILEGLRSISGTRDGEKRSPVTPPREPASIAYILKMYPRLSETFILNELLELERQGVRLRIFSLQEPNDGIVHGDIELVRAEVTYLPWRRVLAITRAHARAFRRSSARYVEALLFTLRRRRLLSVKHFLKAAVIADHVQREGVRHIHAHFASSGASVARDVHRLTGVPYSFTAHARDIYRNDVDIDQLRFKLEQARFAVTVSDYNQRHLARLGGRHIVRIYNGLDLHRFVPNGRAPDDPPLVLAVGRLIEKKGLDVLIRACALLRADGVAFRCVIVGKGELAHQLQTLISSLRLDEHIELTGPLPREKLLELFPRASVVAAPCVVGGDGNRDGLPTVLTEAMALKVPVVATPVTGIPELVEHGQTGLIVPERDPAALAAAIRRLIEEPETARRLAEAGRARVERDFDLHANVGELRALFEEQPR
jgi:colanic acid/amylovoran biosynthesis glycosyltransferase